MKIHICSKVFPQVFEFLKVLLPDEDIFSRAGEDVVRLGMAADVRNPETTWRPAKTKIVGEGPPVSRLFSMIRKA